MEGLHLLNSLKVYWWMSAYIEKHGRHPTCSSIASVFSIGGYDVETALKTLCEIGLLKEIEIHF
jgi:hypothetical protein